MSDQNIVKEELLAVATWLADEYKKITAGVASPAMLDSVMAISYDTEQPIRNIASITSQDARTLFINPWNKEDIPAIESAIRSSGLPLSVSSDGVGVYANTSQLTTESRLDILKLVGEKHEKARVSIRNIRRNAMDAIKKSDIGESEQEGQEKTLQKLIDNTNKTLDEIRTKKEEVVMKV